MMAHALFVIESEAAARSPDLYALGAARDTPLGRDERPRPASAQESFAPPSAAPRPPVSTRPLLAGQYVDAYEQAIYDIDFRSVGGHTSKWIKAVYADGTTVYIDMNRIGDETVDGYEFVRLLDQARVGEGGRVFPGRMNRTTTPRLWAAKHAVEGIVGNYNLAFITQAFTGAVWTLLTATVGAHPTARLMSCRGR